MEDRDPVLPLQRDDVVVLTEQPEQLDALDLKQLSVRGLEVVGHGSLPAEGDGGGIRRGAGLLVFEDADEAVLADLGGAGLA